ncbi:sensor histidine kinase [Actinacidiphila sp. bgisy167]|uniref:sensor histidine kinase n=1 Tax=Actinacidiphila sp. bgisy167 TaxID=3413797 RepID=UPI003D728597
MATGETIVQTAGGPEAAHAPDRAHGRSGLSSWTTRRWLRVGVGVALAVLAALGSLGIWALNRSTTLTDQLVDQRSPALVNAIRLEAALVNQETGIRGYGLSGQRQFLEPYTQGLADERTALDRLHPLVQGDPRARADLDEVADAAAAWQGVIAQPVADARATPGRPVPLATERAGEGRAAFDRVRRSLSAQQEHLRQARITAGEQLEASVRLRNGVFTAIAAVIVLLAVLVFEGLRRGITRPLERLGTDVRHVTRGRFDHPIAATGPADLRRLGLDVEAMRRRLAEELSAAERTRRLLDEQAADLRRSNAELEQFAYVASHDLQEPLRKVSSFTQLLQRRYGDRLDERADQYIAFAVDGANRMQTLISDLLDFSRVGRVHNQHAAVDLDRIADQTADVLSVAIEEAGAEIRRDPLPTVVGDATQLGMLWQNLISNAVKFRHPGRPPRISVTARRDGDLWQFSVADNGIGIDSEFAEKVFVIFQRLHTKDAYPGNGIGLAMCKKIVEFHGGDIAIDPEYGPGARIVFTLPAQQPEAGAGAEPEAGAGAEPQPGTWSRVVPDAAGADAGAGESRP